jgi:hypothetical protein
MKKSILTIAIASLISTAAFANGNTQTFLGAGAVAGTYASGAVTQDHHVGNFVTSGAAVETSAGASVSSGHNSVSADAGSATLGVAGGNGNAGYLGASGAIGTIVATPSQHHGN